MRKLNKKILKEIINLSVVFFFAILVVLLMDLFIELINPSNIIIRLLVYTFCLVGFLIVLFNILAIDWSGLILVYEEAFNKDLKEAEGK